MSSEAVMHPYAKDQSHKWGVDRGRIDVPINSVTLSPYVRTWEGPINLDASAIEKEINYPHARLTSARMMKRSS